MYSLHYLFGKDVQNPTSAITVSSLDLYSPDKGYGFVIEKNRRSQELLQIPELNSAFEPWYWLNSEDISILNQSEDGIFITKSDLYHMEDWPIPLHFKVKLSTSGNYTVSLNLKNVGNTASPIWIFTGRRRLMFYTQTFPVSSELHQTFTINISDIIPRSKTSVYTDNTLDIVIISQANIALCQLDITSSPTLPTLYIAGDSTVTDQSTSYPYHPGCSYCGWGQMLPLFFKPGICISNHAHSGLTSETFRSEGHYDIIYKLLRPGDFVLIQFAHNDQKLPHLAAYKGYTEKLTNYIHELRLKGAIPILVTPLARNTWLGDGSYNDLLIDYANACIQISLKEHVPLIDLHQFSKSFIKTHGLENSKPYFFPNDYTHTNDYGGLQMASYIASELKHLSSLENFISCTIDNEIRSLLQVTQMIKLPSPPSHYIDRNQSNHTVAFTDIEDCKDKDIIISLASKGIISDRETLFRPNNLIIRVEVLEWIIKAIGFVPMNVYNDYYSDVIGHEWYAGTVEVAHQNGIVDAFLTQKALFHPSMPVTTEELISFLINSYKCRKPLHTTFTHTGIELDNVSSFAFNAILSAFEIGLITFPFDPHEKLTRSQAACYIQKLITLLQ